MTSSADYGSASTRSVPLARAELLHVLTLPDFDRADAIGSYWGNPKTRAFAELLIDCDQIVDVHPPSAMSESASALCRGADPYEPRTESSR